MRKSQLTITLEKTIHDMEACTLLAPWLANSERPARTKEWDFGAEKVRACVYRPWRADGGVALIRVSRYADDDSITIGWADELAQTYRASGDVYWTSVGSWLASVVHDGCRRTPSGMMPHPARYLGTHETQRQYMCATEYDARELRARLLARGKNAHADLMTVLV